MSQRVLDTPGARARRFADRRRASAAIGSRRCAGVWVLFSMVVLMVFGGCATRGAFQGPAPVAVPGGGPVVPATYMIGAGDELEVLYYIDPNVDIPEYRIDSGDVLRVDFYYYPVMSKTVAVRPDGCITLPRVGDINARDKRPSELAQEISRLFTPILAKPVITVELIEYNAKIEELKRTIYNQERGMSRLAVVRPDGCISLPYIGDVKTAGLTAHQLRDQLHQRYGRIVYNLSATVVVLRAHSNRVYVMGEVERPNFYEIPGPTTLTQLLAMAGGLTRDARPDQVIIVRRAENGQPDAHIVYLSEIIGENALVDPIIQQYDVVYVPRRAIAEVALTADFLWRIIPLNFSVNYTLQKNID